LLGYGLSLDYMWAINGFRRPGPKAGTAIQGFLNGSIQQASGPHPAVAGWYAYFIQHVALSHVVLFSYLITYGELAVGIGLMLGVFTGIAAFFGIVMNFNYLFAGTVSINPLLILAEIFLVLAWRNAGWIGVDRFLLPELGVPWEQGKFFEKELSPTEMLLWIMGIGAAIIIILSLLSGNNIL
jgi:thiosulfate dehydrogenase [quinone] large subunit